MISQKTFILKCNLLSLIQINITNANKKKPRRLNFFLYVKSNAKFEIEVKNKVELTVFEKIMISIFFIMKKSSNTYNYSNIAGFELPIPLNLLTICSTTPSNQVIRLGAIYGLIVNLCILFCFIKDQKVSTLEFTFRNLLFYAKNNFCKKNRISYWAQIKRVTRT